MLYAQLIHDATSMASAGLGFTEKDFRSAMVNQAGLADQEGIDIYLSAVQTFQLSDNFDFALSSAFAAGEHAGIGVFLKSTGNGVYQDQGVGFSYGRKLFKFLNFGLGFGYKQLSIEQYGNQSAFNGQLGAQVDLRSNISLAFHSYFPFYRDRDFTVTDQNKFNLELAVQIAEKLRLMAGLEKYAAQDLSVQMGMRYQASELFGLQLGLNSTSKQLSAGFYFHFMEQFNLQLSTAYRQDLAWTFGLGLISQFNKP